MKIIVTLLINALIVNVFAEEVCTNIKNCTLWVQSKTGESYELNDYANFKLKESKELMKHSYHTDFVFGAILNANGFTRIKKEEKKYEIVLLKSLDDKKLSLIDRSSIPISFDIYAIEFSLTLVDDKETAKRIVKKLLSKDGRIVEMKDVSIIKVIDNGIHLNMVSLAMKELGKNIIKNKDAFDL